MPWKNKNKTKKCINILGEENMFQTVLFT